MFTYTENQTLIVGLDSDSGLSHRPALVEGRVIKVDDDRVFVLIPNAVATVETLKTDDGRLVHLAVQIRPIDTHELDIMQWGVDLDIVLRLAAEQLTTYEYYSAVSIAA